MNCLDVYADENTMVVDVHNFKVLEAKCYLEKVLAKLDTTQVNEIVVIHGFNNGTKIKEMIYSRLRSKKISRKMSSWNEGRTSLILNTSEKKSNNLEENYV